MGLGAVNICPLLGFTNLMLSKAKCQESYSVLPSSIWSLAPHCAAHDLGSTGEGRPLATRANAQMVHTQMQGPVNSGGHPGPYCNGAVIEAKT